jgi:hypothetical protein
MISYATRGKSITLPITSNEEIISILEPSLFDGLDTVKLNSGYGITNLYVQSDEPFSIRLQDEYDGTWTDPYTPPSNVFNLSNICINDIALTPTIDNQVVYIFASGNRN